MVFCLIRCILLVFKFFFDDLGIIYLGILVLIFIVMEVEYGFLNLVVVNLMNVDFGNKFFKLL